MITGIISVGNDSLIMGANITLLPGYQSTISGYNGTYSFDSVLPGTYTMAVQKPNLLFDTDKTHPFTITAGNSLVVNPNLRTILGSWKLLVDLGGGYSEGGPLVFNSDMTAGIEFDYTGFVYGSWQLQGNNVSFAVSGRTYSGLLDGNVCNGSTIVGTTRYLWRATR